MIIVQRSLKMRSRVTAFVGALAVVASLLVMAPAAQADFGIVPGSFFARTHAPVTTTPTSPDGIGGASTLNAAAEAAFTQWNQAITSAPEVTQAGAHPDASVSFALNQRTNTATGEPAADGNVRDLAVNLPAGLVGNPQASPTCSQQDFNVNETVALFGSCPPASQVGIAMVMFNFLSHTLTQSAPVYNLQPPPGAPAAFGFRIAKPGLLVSVMLTASVRTGGDYGLTVTTSDIPTLGPLMGSTVTIWGVPADPVHDPQRWNTATQSWGASAGVAPTPFLINPTYCDSGPLTTTITMNSWQNPGQFVSASDTAAAPTGCDALSFGGPGAPVSLTAQPDTSVADSPAGLNVQLTTPYDDNPTDDASPTLRNATVTLPPGVTVSPSSANGLEGCSDAQIALSSPNPGFCPDASKLGTATVTTPLLAQPLQGAVYLGTPSCDPCTAADAQDGRMLRLFIEADGSGVVVKLPGTVSANPQTGQLTTTFDNNPQLPFTELDLSFFGGPLASLATPEACGTYTTTSTLTPWSAPESGPPVTSLSSFPVSSGCVNGFSPQFMAGTVNPQAGAFSPFVLSFSRSDTDQDLQGLTARLPEGVLAKLAGVSECTDAQLAAAAANSAAAELASPSCPANTQVGTVQTTAGPGPDPFPLSGKVYLTGPYKGAPFGLAVVVPALAGPFDLGTVVVRQQLQIDPETAQVTAVSDPFPTMLAGIPLRIRTVSVDLNRPDFTVNPTSCDPMAITGTLTSAGGMSENVSSRFQVGGCGDIGFSPKLKIALTGKGMTRSGDHPKLTATLTQGRGQANIKSARVALPLSMALDPNNSDNVCKFATAAAVHGGAVGCAAKTVVGTAAAVTPLLDKPLTSKVYLVQGLRCAKGTISAQGTCANGAAPIHTLPSLLLPMRGQIALDLRAKSSVSGGKLVTTFSTIPDAAVSKFTLNINGGKKGLLVITGRGETICATSQVASETLGAQSGKTHTGNVTLTTPCTKAQIR